MPKCYDVPKVECFHVLSPAPDLACAPRAVQECMDTVKEVPYLYPQEKCYDVPREECRDITEQVPYLYLHISTYLHIYIISTIYNHIYNIYTVQVPVVVCTQIDQTREPKATLVSRPYGR